MKLASASLCALCVFLAGCATQKVTEYRGSAVLPAGAGAVRTVNGIDIWIDGVPNRPYQVIAIVDDDRAPADVAFRDRAVARKVRELNADAAMLGATQRDFRGVMVNRIGYGYFGTPISRAQARYYVLRYAR